MSILIFIAVLVVLIVAHEFGHFVVAKASGIRVDEFGIGFPPRLWGKKVGETEYTVNAIPFGGFVKIFGEDPDQVSIAGPDAARSFVHKPKYIQAAVIVAGVAFNILLAWGLISLGFLIGLPTSADAVRAGATLHSPAVVITDVAPSSPAEHAGVKAGDKILAMESGNEHVPADTVEDVQAFIANHGSQSIVFSYSRGGAQGTYTIVPTTGIVEGRPAVGVALDLIGTLKLGLPQALWEGGKLTVSLTQATAKALGAFLKETVMGKADLSQVTGPVGLVETTGDVVSFGFVYLLSFMALISINLAIINLIPFPALDGGRLLFIIIESIKGSPIKPRIANLVNTVGFALLLLLMVVVTYHDVAKLVTG
ncbi:MAG: RIP metalloprotease RseP [Candidatus Yonathbacteria bacterium RIFCSPHIGHO2_01_FULL_51_10]|uniref:Zinc metalloprotease n=1 Tax=Candidatus Yonathbacteria bacterium RIFCSPHIGHO2_01_FULL_51_10 TaxID=1802723 RepID=A0A1G2S7Z4_9BACT|nr:MAG: RIP metalloprotease RseP [Candidatus Yonathbacteria bacterium RIFCSPHIGHO2_01_FULL_51_10]